MSLFSASNLPAGMTFEKVRKKGPRIKTTNVYSLLGKNIGVGTRAIDSWLARFVEDNDKYELAELRRAANLLSDTKNLTAAKIDDAARLVEDAKKHNVKVTQAAARIRNDQVRLANATKGQSVAAVFSAKEESIIARAETGVTAELENLAQKIRDIAGYMKSEAATGSQLISYIQSALKELNNVRRIIFNLFLMEEHISKALVRE